MRIIPAIDIIDGKCVRLTQGDYASKKIYNEDPREVARGFEGAGLKFLHVVDLDGAKAGKVTNWKAVADISGLRIVRRLWRRSQDRRRTQEVV
jgi:phosphoribosylformimino-5-aminoimidazole carboxamide ribotide isomerase